jgi:hypothetical protein
VTRPKWLIASAALVLLAGAAQLARTRTSNPPEGTSEALQAPPEVAQVLERCCYDCHSNRTQWPWYASVTPVSEFVVKFVAEGRKRMNFSQWTALSVSRRAHRLEDIVEMLTEDEMPPKEYRLMHPQAIPTAAERELVIRWAEAEARALRTPPP